MDKASELKLIGIMAELERLHSAFLELERLKNANMDEAISLLRAAGIPTADLESIQDIGLFRELLGRKVYDATRRRRDESKSP